MLNTFYVVHSKVNESVIQKTFNLLSEAIEYAKGDDDGKRDETYVEAVTADFDEYFNVDETDKKVVWSYDDDSDTVTDTVTDGDIDLSEPDLESLEEHIQDRPAPIELKDNELEGQDNAVVPCKKYKVVAHCEDEKPVDCNMEKEVLPKRLTESYQDEAEKVIKEIAKRAMSSYDYDNNGTGNLDDIIAEAIDDELIYGDDIVALARKYDVLGSDSELISKMYDQVFADAKAATLDLLKEKGYFFSESLTEDTSAAFRGHKNYTLIAELETLRAKRIDKYAQEGYKVADMTNEELYDLDDGDNLLQGIDIVLNALTTKPVQEGLEEDGGLDTEIEDFIKNWAQEDYDNGQVMDSDDFEEFKKICIESGYEGDEDFYEELWSRYYECVDAAREADGWDDEEELTEYLVNGLKKSRLTESPLEDRIEEIKLIAKQRPLTDDEIKEFAELIRKKNN